MSSSLIRHDVLPVGVGYLLLMGALGAGLWLIRRQHSDAAATGPAETSAAPRPDWPRLARHYAGTAIGGYLLLMAVVVLYYYGVARVGGAFIVSAFTGCALLIALSTPVFALASWLTERRRARSPADRDPSAPSTPSGL
jgi:Family of unknown function (DUF6256)